MIIDIMVIEFCFFNLNKKEKKKKNCNITFLLISQHIFTSFWLEFPFHL